MQQIPWIAAMIVAGAFPGRIQAVSNRFEAEQGLVKIEHEWDKAIVKKDLPFLDRILSEDYLLTAPDGQVVTREQLLASFQTPRADSLEIITIRTEDVVARIYGETAVVQSRFTVKGKVRGRDVETPFRHTDIFVWKRGGWKCLARQATRITAADVQTSANPPR